MTKRPQLTQKLELSIRRNPVTAILGPRQCGKTTLARLYGKNKPSTYIDLENPLDMVRMENPMRNLESLNGLVIMDEIQRQPKLFEILRVLADRKPARAKFLILGSASFELIRKSSESLAGRIEFVEMGGFSNSEIPSKKSETLWIRGGFPKSFLAKTDRESRAWRETFTRTFLERDIPQLGIQIPALSLRRFWTMIAHCHGQVWNGSEIGSSLGIAHTTARQYLDILTGTFVVRQLTPWFSNLKKRMVKSPKIYIRDSGLLHTLLRIPDFKNLETHPKLGPSWEGFAMEQILNQTGEYDSYFWATHAGAELDLVLIRNGKKWGFEFKYNEAPTITKSMRIAMNDLNLHHLWVIYPGKVSYSLDKKMDCVGISDLKTIFNKVS